MSQDTGLIKRGLLLLAMMSALVVVVLVIIFQRPTATLPGTDQRPELLAASIVRTDTAFPGAVAWHAIVQMGEAFPSTEGWKVRYNAAGALARKGSTQVPWDIILEMLDENRQMRAALRRRRARVVVRAAVVAGNAEGLVGEDGARIEKARDLDQPAPQRAHVAHREALVRAESLLQSNVELP